MSDKLNETLPPGTPGEKLRDLRVNRGMTLDNVADATQLSKSTVSNYETNKTGMKIEILDILVKFYGVSIAYILQDPANPAAKPTAEDAEPVNESSEDNKPSLLDVFEDAIDTYGIVVFLILPFSYSGMDFDRKYYDNANAFIVYLDGVIPSYRRQEGSLTGYIFDFTITLRNYLDFIGTYLSFNENDDAKTFCRDKGIDKSAFQEGTVDFQRQFIEIYKLISNGGALLIQ
jgi:transcriptional regulator with XRE-family HTH domain